MKKIVLFLAAVAALASCVKENTLVPEQTSDNLVTITAVSADTKTVLDGTDVVWENTDVIKVVHRGTSETLMSDFSVDGSANGSSATFRGPFEYNEGSDYNPYAVYPASSVTKDEGTGNAVIKHTLPATQTGVITSGMNLSSAILSAEDLLTGTATATFNNALTLLQVVVPEGVKSVALTADYGLVGSATFTVEDKDSQGEPTGENDGNGNPIYEKIAATGKLTTSGGDEKTVILSNGDAALAAGTHSVLVYPGTNTNLTLNMVGTSGLQYEKTISGITFTASEYRTINLANIFRMETQETLTISPAGGECYVDVYSVEDFTYNVEITNNTDNWLTYTPPTKAFHKDVLTFSAEENETGATRTADVTITWGDNNKRSFKVSQQNLFLDFVEDEDGNPIQWEENVVVYATESDATNQTNPKGSFKNIFTISLNEDPSIAYCYKVENLFANNNGGATYYADYVDDKLIVYVSEENPLRTYYFKNETVTLVYDSVNKAFSSETIIAETKSDFTGFANKDCFIGYSASVKVKSSDFILGTYLEAFTSSGTSTAAPGKNLTIEASDDPSKGDILITSFLGQTSLKLYGQRETIISVAGDPGNYSVFLGNIGPCPAFTLTIADGVATFDESVIAYPTISGYSATGSSPALGTYLEAFTSSGTSTAAPGKNLTIEASDDPSKGDVLLTSFLGQTSLKLYGQLVTKIAVAGDPGNYSVFLGNIGPCPTFTLTIADGVATFDESVIAYPTISGYTATKQ